MEIIYNFNVSRDGVTRTQTDDDWPVHVLDKRDYSSVYKHWQGQNYDPECSCCWLGITHSESKHNDSLTMCRAWCCKQAPHNKADHK